MDPSNPSLFGGAALESPASLALSLAPAAPAGHYDELRAQARPDAPAAGGPAALPQPRLAPHWHEFFNELGAAGFAHLDQRLGNLQRQIRDNGVSYNVYADVDGPQRPWALDLLPMMLSPADWLQIEAGVRQRARLLEAIMADAYGPQTLTQNALLPEALVRGHPGYLRAMHGIAPVGGSHLHIAAFDLARGPDGQWWVVSQRTQAPSGLGYLLENRLSISLQFPEAFRAMKVRRLAATYRALVEAMKAACPRLEGDGPGQEKRIVLLTPGPYNETYFEHAYLARYLGLTLAEGSDLLVRGERLYLKTIRGLEPVHGVLKRLDDEFLDPLELRADSTLGVPGLLQVLRAGHVLMANAPGSAFLESPALLGFLPALSKHLLGEALQLPSLATWWCGEQAALEAVLPQLRHCVIKRTYPGSRSESVIARLLSRPELEAWSARLLQHGDEHTIQAYMPLAQTPTWQEQRLSPRSFMVRVFALADGQGSWRVLPGGLARLAGRNENIASMQQGGSSADVWVLGQSLDEARADRAETPAQPAVGHKPAVSSRSAENLFWLGRYTERAENTTRLAQLTLQALSGEDHGSPALLAWLSDMATANGLVLPSVLPATQARRVFERALIANLGEMDQAPSVGFNLRALKGAASAVRERLSLAQWQTVVRAEADFLGRCSEFSGPGLPGRAGREHSTSEALRALDAASQHLAAMTGAQTDRMMRDDGWRLLSIGRHVERLAMLSSALASCLSTGALREDAGFRAVLALFDSTITFQAQFQQRRDLAALLDLLVMDPDNPRSLAWVVQTLRARLARLAQTPTPAEAELAQALPDPAHWALGRLCRRAAPGPDHDEALARELTQACGAALELSNRVSQRYFSHAAGESVSVGA